jgi:hypothetical protein
MRVHTLVLATLVALGGTSHAAEEFIYTVQVGYHPWNIAQRYLKDTTLAQRLTRLNRISNDRRVAPGTQLRIPAQWLKLQAAQVRVLAAHGRATIEQPGQASRAAVLGEMLPVPAQLRTGPRSSVMLEFDDGSRVMMGQASDMRVLRSDRRMLDGGFMVELELLRGSLENMVTPRLRPPDTRFEIRSPAAVAAVRGTRFRVHADPATTWAEVLDGAVQVGNDAGAVRAEAGFGTVAQAGRAPEPPQPLLAAPDLSVLPARLERLPIDWPLPPVPGAVSYRTQVAPDTRFDSVVSDEQTTPARARVLDIDDGNYILRVRAIDAQGLEGLASERPVLVYARPQAPALISPEPDATVATPRPTFRWTEADATWHYRIEIRRDAPTTEVPWHAQTATSAHGTESTIDLPPGVYHWRVASVIPASGRQGPWGDTQSFRVVLPPPEPEPVQIQPGNVTIRWPTLPNASAYDLQVTPGTDFTQALIDIRSSTPQHQLRDLAPGAYQLRIRAISQDGFAGPWGRPQGFVIPEPVKPAPEPSPWRALLILLPALILFGL